RATASTSKRPVHRQRERRLAISHRILLVTSVCPAGLPATELRSNCDGAARTLHHAALETTRAPRRSTHVNPFEERTTEAADAHARDDGDVGLGSCHHRRLAGDHRSPIL